MYVTHATNTANAEPRAAGSTGAGGVDYQSFLKLLVAELKNQDPTQPMDSTEYVAQLATFSQVEQSIQVNKKLEQMLQTSSVTQADALLGRTVTSADGSISGVVAEVRLTADGVIAVLEGGAEVQIQSGVTVRQS